ncbi:MAG: helix-turn-helix transcriptional regulator [Proteobacteria bacterium]|nr:helix-turn-helix transcriptional regulator [Pseudomonadota bacterium]
MSSTFANILHRWRKHRRYSQLQLALELGISSKHISFLETGRSAPSQQMILKIGLFLLLPKGEINHALNAAGYAPAYTEQMSSHTDLKPVFSAINQMLNNHMPYPAIVLNQHWDLVNANDAAKQLLHDMGFSKHSNLIEALIDDDVTNSKIINWHESIAQLLLRLRSEICLLGGYDKLIGLEKKLSEKITAEHERKVIEAKHSVLTTQIGLHGKVFSFFSIIANLGTVQDVAVSEFRIELMFPANDETLQLYPNK